MVQLGEVVHRDPDAGRVHAAQRDNASVREDQLLRLIRRRAAAADPENCLVTIAETLEVHGLGGDCGGARGFVGRHRERSAVFRRGRALPAPKESFCGTTLR